MKALGIRVFLTYCVLALFIMNPATARAGIPGTGSCTELHSADRLWRGGKFQESQNILKEMIADSAYEAEDRAGALQRLASQVWLQSGTTDSAMALLKKAENLMEGTALTYAMMSRFLLYAGDNKSAISLSERAFSHCRRLTDSIQAVTAYARAVFAAGHNEYLTGNMKELSGLQDAAKKLLSIGGNASSQAYLWEMLLGISLLLKDGPTALQAWRRYFDLEPGDLPDASIVETASALSDILPSWNGNDLDQVSCEALIKALADSRMYDYARLVAAAPGLPYGENLRDQPDIADIIRYAELIEQAQVRIDQIYRKRLTQDSTILQDIQEFQGLAYNYWMSLDYPGGRPEFSTDELGAQLVQRWGAAFANADFSPDNFEMNWGHAIYEIPRTIEQYGHEAEVRVIVLDQMVSNGMIEWLTDGDVQIGGWAPVPETIYWIRPAYYWSSIHAWETVASSKERARIEERIENLRSVDDSLAQVNPYAHLPGASIRIKYAGLRRLYDSLAASGRTGNTLRRVFLQEFEHRVHEASIFAHEGRHAIDMTVYGDEFNAWDGPTTEFSAKVSEILFSPNPWFSVGLSAALFYSSGSDDTTSAHGGACYRMRRSIVEWMEQHAEEIEDFDRSRPTLPQVDLLSTQQLSTFLKEIDPLTARTSD